MWRRLVVCRLVVDLVVLVAERIAVGRSVLLRRGSSGRKCALALGLVGLGGGFRGQWLASVLVLRVVLLGAASVSGDSTSGTDTSVCSVVCVTIVVVASVVTRLVVAGIRHGHVRLLRVSSVRVVRAAVAVVGRLGWLLVGVRVDIGLVVAERSGSSTSASGRCDEVEVVVRRVTSLEIGVEHLVVERDSLGLFALPEEEAKKGCEEGGTENTTDYTTDDGASVGLFAATLAGESGARDGSALSQSQISVDSLSIADDS